MLLDTGTYCHIACYLNNQLRKRFDSDADMQEEIFNAMQSKKNVKNTLVVGVETKR